MSDEEAKADDGYAQLRGLIGTRLEPYVKRIAANIQRVQGLIQVHGNLGQASHVANAGDQDDILRAAVVLAHATLEDFLRTLARNFLPLAGEKTLSRIPLKGQDGRAEKFTLGQLGNFRGQTVEQVIRDSVDAYLERSNYNDTAEVAQLLADVGLPVEKVNRSFSKLAELMERRHQIVHRADLVEGMGDAKQQINKIERGDVQAWAQAVVDLISDVLPTVGMKHLVSEGIVKLEEGNYFVDTPGDTKPAATVSPATPSAFTEKMKSVEASLQATSAATTKTLSISMDVSVVAPVGEILKAWNDVEGLLATAVAEGNAPSGFIVPDVVDALAGKGILEPSTRDSVIGLYHLRNLAAHDPERISPSQAKDFVTMAMATKWAVEQNFKKHKARGASGQKL